MLGSYQPLFCPSSRQALPGAFSGPSSSGSALALKPWLCRLLSPVSLQQPASAPPSLVLHHPSSPGFSPETLARSSAALALLGGSLGCKLSPPCCLLRAGCSCSGWSLASCASAGASLRGPGQARCSRCNLGTYLFTVSMKTVSMCLNQLF